MTTMKIRWKDREGSAEIAPGVTIWERATATVAPYKGYEVEATMALSPRGRFEVEVFTVRQLPDGEPVTGEALRQITVQALVIETVKLGIQESIGRDIPEGTEVVALNMLRAEDARQLKADGPTPETLQWVGRIYRVAEVLGDAPTKAVEQAFSVSRSTAGAWIGRARAAGLIPPVDAPKEKRDGEGK